MKCPKCGNEMRNGYVFCSKDGAFSFANEVPGAFENAKSTGGFVMLVFLQMWRYTAMLLIGAFGCFVAALNFRNR